MRLRRRALAALTTLLAAGPAGCTESADGALLERFGARLPPPARVERFECSGFGVDHADVWVIAPATDAAVAALVQGAGLRPERDGDAGGLLSDRWPAWWPQGEIEALPAAYRREGGAGDAGAREHRRVWVDAARGRVYVQFFTT